MATEYTFVDDNTTLDSTILVEENTVWEQDETVYSDAVDVTLEANATRNFDAPHDSDNDTHYFSILDNSGLNDLNQTTLNNTELEIGEQQNPIGNDSGGTVEMGGQPVILFKLDGSDDLYGLQVAQDEDGNYQKFQYKVRFVILIII